MNLTIQLNLPESANEMSEAELRELLFDDYVNYVTVSHCEDATKWCAIGKVGSDDEESNAKQIFEHHQLWSKITSDVQWGV